MGARRVGLVGLGTISKYYLHAIERSPGWELAAVCDVRESALAPHREGVLRMQRDLMRDPLSVLLLSPILMASMAWTLEGAGISTAGIAGALRVQGLAGVWIAAARAWENDESVDLGTTMAALDRALDRAEGIARTLRLTDEEAVETVSPIPDSFEEPPIGDTGSLRQEERS